MGTLSLFPLSLSSTLRPNPSSSTFRTQLSNPIFYPLLSSTTHRNSQRFHFPSKTIAFGSNTNDPKESLFLDENGGVDDMDGYLNYLSLEYDSVWDTKPSWWIFLFMGLSHFHWYFTILIVCHCLFVFSLWFQSLLIFCVSPFMLKACIHINVLFSSLWMDRVPSRL